MSRYKVVEKAARNDARPDERTSPGESSQTSDDALKELLRRINANKPKHAEFFLVVEDDEAFVQREAFESIELLVARMRELDKEPCRVFAGMGEAFPFTRGPYRYLLTQQGQVPLFQVPSIEHLEVQTDGALGPEERVFEIPQSPEPPDDDEAEEVDIDPVDPPPQQPR